MNKSPATDSRSVKNLNKNKIIILVFFATVLGYLFVTVVVPMVRGNGLSSFSGPQAQVAERALEFARHAYDTYNEPIIPVAYFHIDEVRVTTKDEQQKYCNDPGDKPTDDASRPEHYTVIVSEGEYFNPVNRKLIFDGCNFYQEASDGSRANR